MKNIILAPIVSEKAASQAGVLNTYHFKVAIDTNKIEVKRAVEKRFDVKVEDVRILRRKGKVKTQYTKTARLVGKKADYKKAVVRLKDGYKLDLYSTAE
jgi:large subunit ribosomal protein L23